MSLMTIITLYVLCTAVTLIPFYYIISHLLYSINVYVNFLAIIILVLCALFHFAAFRTGVIPFFDVDISGDGSMGFVLIPFVCAYSYAIPFYIAQSRYYNR